VIIYFISGNFYISTIPLLVVVLLFAHRKGKRPSTKQKHTARRSGEVYDNEQNEKRGEKNKKYKKPENPNKKRKEDTDNES